MQDLKKFFPFTCRKVLFVYSMCTLMHLFQVLLIKTLFTYQKKIFKENFNRGEGHIVWTDRMWHVEETRGGLDARNLLVLNKVLLNK